MRLTRNSIALLGNFGKIDPRIHFDVFQITLTYVRAILKNIKIDLGLFFPNCPQSHAITSTNKRGRVMTSTKFVYLCTICEIKCYITLNGWLPGPIWFSPSKYPGLLSRSQAPGLFGRASVFNWLFMVCFVWSTNIWSSSSWLPCYNFTGKFVFVSEYVTSEPHASFNDCRRE